jgi:hypothetical protein
VDALLSGAVLRPEETWWWLDVPFRPRQQGAPKWTHQAASGNHGFVVNTQHIVASKGFRDQKTPAAGKLFFEIMKVSVNDINAQNLRMSCWREHAAGHQRGIPTDGSGRTKTFTAGYPKPWTRLKKISQISLWRISILHKELARPNSIYVCARS